MRDSVVCVGAVARLRNGRFLLAGSANLLLMQRVSETLASRATYVNLVFPS